MSERSSVSTWPAPTTVCPSTSSSPARSPSTRRTVPARPVMGLGIRKEVDPDLVITSVDDSIEDGVIIPFSHRATTALLRPGPRRDRQEGGGSPRPRRGSPSRPGTSGPCCTARTRRSTSATPTATAASVRTTPASKAPSRGCSASTSRPTPTTSGTRSRSTCERCRAQPVRAPGYDLYRCTSSSRTPRSPRWRPCRSGTARPSSAGWS